MASLAKDSNKKQDSNPIQDKSICGKKQSSLGDVVSIVNTMLGIKAELLRVILLQIIRRLDAISAEVSM